MIGKLFVPVGVIILLVIYYTLGAIPLFCIVIGLMVGSLIELIESNERNKYIKERSD